MLMRSGCGLRLRFNSTATRETLADYAEKPSWAPCRAGMTMGDRRGAYALAGSLCRRSACCSTFDVLRKQKRGCRLLAAGTGCSAVERSVRSATGTANLDAGGLGKDVDQMIELAKAASRREGLFTRIWSLMSRVDTRRITVARGDDTFRDCWRCPTRVISAPAKMAWGSTGPRAVGCHESGHLVPVLTVPVKSSLLGAARQTPKSREFD